MLHERGEMMISKKLTTKTFLVAMALSAMLCAAVFGACTGDAGPSGTQAANSAAASQGTPEREGDSDGEHGGGREGNGSGEHGPGGEHGSGGEDGEGNEAAMSSPITPLDEPWNGVLSGLEVAMRYDAATQSVQGTVRNTLSQKLCYVQAEPHLKSGPKTVGELGPEKLGDLDPGQETKSSLAVADEPKLAGVSFDGYVVHMEVFDCAGPGPSAHSEGGEGSSEHGDGEHGRGSEHVSGGEHGHGGEGGHESTGADGKEGNGANPLASDETLEAIHSGVRLILKYDAPSNAFRGTAENTTNGVLDRVRIEVHLSNGAELGPTTPTELAPGEVAVINLPASPASFTGWTAHAEVGASGDEHRVGGEHGHGGESGHESK